MFPKKNSKSFFTAEYAEIAEQNSNKEYKEETREFSAISACSAVNALGFVHPRTCYNLEVFPLSIRLPHLAPDASWPRILPKQLLTPTQASTSTRPTALSSASSISRIRPLPKACSAKSAAS